MKTGTILLLLLLFLIVVSAIRRRVFETGRKARRDYYRNVYLRSDNWRRKRYVMLRRDNWTCVYCGARATNVHHMRYARRIGNEPIEWLVSVCESCHSAIHDRA